MHSLLGSMTTLHGVGLYIEDLKRIKYNWIRLMFMFPLLLHPIPYLRCLGELDIEAEKERWKEIIKFLGYHTMEAETYPMAYDIIDECLVA
jgi:hypothetical protein